MSWLSFKMSYDFSSLCRICLKQKEDTIHIFYAHSSYPDELSLHAQLIACCPIQVYLEDGLPQQICSNCYQQLKVAYDLRELSITSDATLRKYISSAPSDSLLRKYLCTTDRSETTIVEKESMNQSSSLNDLDVPLSASTSLPVIATTDCPNTTKKKKKKKLSSENSKTYTCLECGKSFVYKCLLRDHLVQHSGVKPFLCSACGKSFAHHTTLTNHMKTHFEKQHKCTMCPQTFHRKSHLILHIRTHTGEKPFVCPHCGKDFAQTGYLKEHMRIHSGEKPFVCETCGRGFARKSCLIMHRRTHTGELPYPCPECSRCFSQRSQRKRHVLRNHKGSVALRENGELILREHDQLHAVLSTIKTNDKGSDPMSPVHNPSYQSLQNLTGGMH